MSRSTTLSMVVPRSGCEDEVASLNFQGCYLAPSASTRLEAEKIAKRELIREGQETGWDVLTSTAEVYEIANRDINNKVGWIISVDALSVLEDWISDEPISE